VKSVITINRFFSGISEQERPARGGVQQGGKSFVVAQTRGTTGTQPELCQVTPRTAGAFTYAPITKRVNRGEWERLLWPPSNVRLTESGSTLRSTNIPPCDPTAARH